MTRLSFAAVLVLCVQSVAADEAALRRSAAGKSNSSRCWRERLAALARELLRRCQHPGNFGLAAIGVEQRWKLVIEGSRLRVVSPSGQARDDRKVPTSPPRTALSGR